MVVCVKLKRANDGEDRPRPLAGSTGDVNDDIHGCF